MDKKKTLPPKKNVQLKKKTSTLAAPNIDTMFNAARMPGLPPITKTDPEEIAAEECSNMMSAIRENRRSYTENFRDIEAGEFWFCVCFQTRSQKDEFLSKLFEKYDPGNTTFGDKYVSGLELAAMLGIPVEPIILESKKNRLAPKSMRGMEVI